MLHIFMYLRTERSDSCEPIYGANLKSEAVDILYIRIVVPLISVIDLSSIVEKNI